MIMRTLKKNKQNLYYANQDREVPIYEEYEDEDGNTYPIDTGETRLVYGEPIPFRGNIAMSGGEVEAQEFGLDISAYEAILVLSKNTLPITETSLIWYENAPQIGADGFVDEFSADYKIVKISPSLNYDKFVLKKVVK